ncbi:MAG: MG2 domain-containing protein [Planctomycetaceae bacterium]
MKQSNNIQQTLLELHYGLLDDAAAARWQKRIASEEDVALAWAEVLKLTGQFAEAAKLQGIPHDKRVQSPSAEELLRASADARARRVTKWRLVRRTLAAVAILWMCGFVGVRFVQRLPNEPMLPLRLQATSISDGVRSKLNQFQFTVSRGDRRVFAMPATLHFQVQAANVILHQQDVSTDQSGRVTYAVPANLKLPRDSQLYVTATAPDGSHTQAHTTLPLEPTRCLTYLTVDRPLYRPGETILFRSLTLERHSLRADVDVPIHFELRDPSGAAVPNALRDGVTQRGVGNGAFALPSSATGGEYTLVARSLDGFFPEEQRKLLVQQYRVPRFKKEIEFKRRSHGPGDLVEADFSAARAEGGPLAKAKVRITATVDGHEVARQESLTSEVGTCVVSFRLPEHIADGDGQLAVSIDDGGTQETQVKTIPIQLGKVKVEFYPEGGHLVAGLENRVYFAARNPLGKPIHIAGQVLDQQGREVARAETVRDGLGSFRFTPSRGERYVLKVAQPVDVTNAPELPAVITGRPVLDTGRGVFAANEPISFKVRTESAMPILVQASCRGVSVGESKFTLTRGSTTLKLPISANVGGVIRLTVSNTLTTPATPLVERLVFRQSDAKLQVRLVERSGEATTNPKRQRGRTLQETTHSERSEASALADASGYIPESIARSPGDPLRLTLQVTDENDRPTAAMLGVAVVDDAALSLDEHERPTLRTHFLLTSEINNPEDLEHANFYLPDSLVSGTALAAGHSREDTETESPVASAKPLKANALGLTPPRSPNASAAEAVDLLLGTQGWRRFVEKNTSEPNPDFRQQVAKLIDLDGRANQPSVFDNGPVIEQQTAIHSQNLNAAWSQLLSDIRVVLVVILTAWLFSILMRPRWRTATGAGLWLWLAAMGTSCWLVGCGEVQSSRATARKIDRAAGGAPHASAEAMMPFDAMSASEEMPSETAKFAMAKPFADMGDASDGEARSLRTAPPAILPQSSTSEPSDPAANQSVFGEGKSGSAVAAGASSAPAKDTFATRLLSADDLRRLLAARGLNADGLSGQLLDELRFPVREYAHKHVRRESGLREDFTETLFWQPLLITDANGEATIRFDLSDSVTTFRVLADAHTGDGRIGSGGGEVLSRLPFQIEPKLPLEVTTGDRIDLPVAVINRTSEQQQVQLGLSADGTLQVVGDKSRSVTVAANDQRREHISLNVTHGSAESDAFIEVRAVGQGGRLAGDAREPRAPHSDAVRRKLHVAPAGYPIRDSLAGVINGVERLRLKIPSEAVPGSLAVTLRAYPSPLADLLSGVESILHEPHGCFEQTTSTNYPNTMALQYLQQNQLANPNVTRKAKDFLDRGYQKLTSFECKQRGYEWFGSDPGHEALTAFGLMQYHDMAEVMPVDAEMVERTRTWLLNRRNGQGGFHRNPRHLHVWSVQQDIVDAYVLWALTEADAAERNSKSQNSNPKSPSSDLQTELDHLTAVANGSRDSYLIALSAAALLNAGRTADGERLLQTLTELQAADGSLTGSTTVTQSGGLSLKMETTALATIAWLKSPRFHGATDRAAKWIVTHREGHGGFGSTQATVLALKALVGYAKTSNVARRGGSLQVVRDQEVLAQMTLPEGADASSTIELTGIGSKLVPGETDLELRAPGFGRLSYAMEVLYHTPKPPSDPNCPVRLTTTLASRNETATLTAGDTVRLEALLKNTTERGLPMTVAVLGFPAGLEPRAEELNELREAGAFDYYELRPREILCYWRTIHPQAEHRIAITLNATIPGEYTAPASRAYLYYTAEQKHWVEPLRVRITP